MPKSLLNQVYSSDSEIEQAIPHIFVQLCLPSCASCNNLNPGTLSIVDDRKELLSSTLALFTVTSGVRGYQNQKYVDHPAVGMFPSSDYSGVQTNVYTSPVNVNSSLDDKYYEVSPCSVPLPTGVVRHGFGISFLRQPGYGSPSNITFQKEAQWREFSNFLTHCANYIVQLPLVVIHR